MEVYTKNNLIGGLEQLFAPSVLGFGFAETPITADKREIKDFSKLPSATSFIRKTLSEIALRRFGEISKIKEVEK